MKLKFLFFLAFICCLIENAYACGPDLLPFFDTAYYFDQNMYDELFGQGKSDFDDKIGVRNKFKLMLQQYQGPQQNMPEKQGEDKEVKVLQKKAIDADARMRSEKEEPEDYKKYLEGAKKFNDGEYEDALKIFTAIKASSTSFKRQVYNLFTDGKQKYSWVLEATTYMIARCQLVIAQKNWDGYGFSESMKKIDQQMLTLSDASYKHYLTEYPKGLYFNSAYNIHRFLLYLSGNQTALDAELRRVMLEAFPVSSDKFKINRSVNLNILNEFQIYFKGDIDRLHDSPVLLAYAWMGIGEKKWQPKIEDLASLKAREKDFDAYPGLFRYVQALGLYRLGLYQELLDKTPEKPLVKNVLSLSTQYLRARAFLQLGKIDAALSAFEKMYDISPEDAIEVEIATFKLNRGEGLWLYTKSSPLKIAKNLEAFARFALTDEELEKGLHMKEIVGEKRNYLVNELALRYLWTQRFKELAALFSKEQKIPSLSTIKLDVIALAHDDHNFKALANIGEFVYQQFMMPISMLYSLREPNADLRETALLQLSERCEPCKAFNERVKSYVPPIVFFRSALKLIAPLKGKYEIEAKLLRRIVWCGKSGEFAQRCTWNESGCSDNQEVISAFRRLHKLYGKSASAKETPYYFSCS